MKYPLNEKVSSTKRIKYILSEYNIKSDSIENLSEQLYLTLEPLFTTIIANKVKGFKETFVRPIISRCYDANKLNSNRITKISYFIESLGGIPYYPKIVDFCLHLLLKSDSETLLKGFFKKMKTELENTLNDIAIYEISMIANFINPFENLRPRITFFTTDKNLHYYASLGKPLILIEPDDSFQRFYYPDLNAFKATNKEKNIIKQYFKGHDLNEFIEILTLDNFDVRDITKNNWDEFAYFKNQQ